MLHNIYSILSIGSKDLVEESNVVEELIEEQTAIVNEKAVETMDWLEKITPELIKFGKKLLVVLIIIFIGRKLVKILTKALNKTFKKIGMEEGLSRFLNSFIHVVLGIVVLVIIAGYIGIETSSLVALVGSAGLTLGLALQGSLSNFAGGVLILLSKPFVMGDYIVTPMGEGFVVDMGIVYTKLCTFDKQIIVIPNGSLANSNITNVYAEKQRIVDMEIGVAYDTDLKKVRRVVNDLIKKQELILKDEEIKIFVKDFAESSINIGIRFFVKPENYWDAKWNFQEDLKETFDRENIVIPFNQMDIHVIKDEVSENELISKEEKELEKSLGRAVKKELEKQKGNK